MFRLFSFYIRAIDAQALIGTIGGYIGLFLGYSLLQVPSAISFFVTRLSNSLIDLKSGKQKANRVLTPSKMAHDPPHKPYPVEVQERINYSNDFMNMI